MADPARLRQSPDPHLLDLLRGTAEHRASDLHLAADFPAVYRVDGALLPATPQPLPRDFVHHCILSILNDPQTERLFAQRELDFALHLPGVGRFRVNCHWQRGALEAAFRRVNEAIPSFADLELPPLCERLCNLRHGLVLVTGPAGMGKSTTLAAMVDRINQTQRRVVITVEDPIEYIHSHKLCLIKQREVGSDTRSFADALRHALRQDPDVLLVGEMRDLETISCAITAAETGHLVLSTLHTPDAVQTIDRLIDVFPAERQPMVMSQLATCLQAVISQVLLPRADAKGRICAREILIANPAIRTCIREHQTHQILSHIQLGAKEGMTTLDQALDSLVRAGRISPETAAPRLRSHRS